MGTGFTPFYGQAPKPQHQSAEKKKANGWRSRQGGSASMNRRFAKRSKEDSGTKSVSEVEEQPIQRRWHALPGHAHQASKR